MKPQLHLALFKLALLCLALGAAAKARSQEPVPAPVEITVDASQTGAPINPYIYGQFIEHMGRCINGGIWAEMLEDRKFYFPVPAPGAIWKQNSGQATVLAASPWKVIGPAGTVQMVEKGAYVGRQTPQITAPGGGRTVGIYQEELGLVTNKSYTGYIVLAGEGEVAPVTVSLAWGEGSGNQAEQRIRHVGAKFARVPFRFTAGAASDNGRLAITTSGKGRLKIGCVSLMPGDNVEGFRKDTLELLKQLGGTIYRWPGGNFVSGYDWRDGVGERDKRPPRANPAWTGLEPNDMGLAEFARFCELAGAEPMIAVNTGFGDADSAAAEVEYVNGPAATPMGKWRAKNGHPKPFAVKWWCVGNEMFGSWQLGCMASSQYVLKHNWVEEKMREADPAIQTIASGNVGAWSRAMLSNCAGQMNLISEHFYVNTSLPDVAAHVQQVPARIKGIAEAHRQYRREIPSLQGRDIRVAVDEWNYSYGPQVFGEGGRRSFLKDALGIAAGLHEFFRNSDIIDMATYAQTVNVLGCIKTTKTRAEFEASAFPLMLYRAQFGTLPVAVEHPGAPVDIAAALTRDKKILTIGVVNPKGESVALTLNLKSARMTGYGKAWLILGPNPPDPLACNQPGEKRRVDMHEYPSNLIWPVTVPAYSIALFRFPVAQDSAK
jgi:alpha-N-arabinofuranosidase